MKTIKILFVSALLLISSNIYSQICTFTNVSDIGGTPTNYSGNQILDQSLTQEYYKLVYAFGVRPKSFYIQEYGSPNAFASKINSDINYPDGSVVLGLKLISNEILLSSSQTYVGIALVMAHEFAHILDFKYKYITRNGKYPELFADFMAGVYLHTRAVTYAYTNIQEAATRIFSMGDYNPNHPLHHGTPQERMDAMLSGYRFSVNMVNSGRTSFSIFEAANTARNYINQIP